MFLPARAASMIRRMWSVGKTMPTSRSNVLAAGWVRLTATLSQAFGLPIDGIDQRLVEIILRFEDELLGRAVFPGGRAQVAERDLALPVIEFRYLTELQRIALAGTAGEIIEDSTARGHRRRIT